VDNVHLSRIEGESWAGAVPSEAPFSSDASSRSICLLLAVHIHLSATCKMVPDRQPNTTTMPFDQEGMKGYEVDGAIAERYMGSAGELLILSWTSQRRVC
jgi:hypothetical protein